MLFLWQHHNGTAIEIELIFLDISQFIWIFLDIYGKNKEAFTHAQASVVLKRICLWISFSEQCSREGEALPAFAGGGGLAKPLKIDEWH